MKKLIFKINSIIFVAFLFFCVHLSAEENINTRNINLDLSKHARNISLTPTDENNFVCLLEIKFKKNAIPLQNDTLNLYCNFTSNFSTSKIKYEILSDEKSIYSDILDNTETKNKKFSSSSSFILTSDLTEKTVVKLSFSDISIPKPWIQLKEVRIPKEKNKKNNSNETDEEEITEETVSFSNDSDDLNPSDETASTNNTESIKTNQDIYNKDETTTNDISQTESSLQTEEELQIDSKKEKSKNKAQKKNKKDPKADTIIIKSNENLPEEILEYIKTVKDDTENWFINSISKKDVISKVSGPFSTKEQAIVVWIYKSLPENDIYSISKNDSYIVSTPSTVYAKTYKEIQDYINEYGIEETINKYFYIIKTEIDISQQNTQTEQDIIKNDILLSSEKQQSNQNEDTKKNVNKPTPTNKPDTIVNQDKKENSSSDSDIKEQKTTPQTNQNEIENTFTILPSFELPLNKNTKNNYFQYDKEYLQDYIPKKQQELPKESVSESSIENPNETDSFGRTLLMKAAQNGNNWEIKSLLASGADINLKDKDGWTALMYAVRYQENITIVETLINAGAKIKIKNNFGFSPLVLASAYNGNPEIIKKLLTFYSVSEKEVLQAFIMLLSDNSSSDFAKIAKIEEFLYKSIPLNTFYNGKTPLMYAAQYSSSTKILKRLLQEGAITSIRSTEGKTAFDYAQENIMLSHDDVYWSLNKK